MNAFDLARLYYPRLWSAERIIALKDAGKLSEQEAQAILKGTA